MNNRVEQLIKQGGNGAFVFHKSENVAHFSGFTGEGMVVIGKDMRRIITDFRYDEQAQQQSPGWDVILIDSENSHLDRIAQAVSAIGAPAHIEMDHISMDHGNTLQKKLGNIPMVSMNGLPEKLRMVKDEAEIEIIAKAAKITDATFEYVLTIVKPGMSEAELEMAMYIHMRELGSQGPSFSTIVASGPNSSLPHATPGERHFQSGDLVTLDFGAGLDGYCSDFTRTFAIGKVDPELRKIYDIVLEAQLASLDALCAGKTGKQVDSVARDIITKAGYGPQFGHGLGHGVGRMIHEDPRLSIKGDTVLEPNMVVTIEPGIYLPGKGGVRIEDLCLVTEDGCRLFSASTKEWIEI